MAVEINENNSAGSGLAVQAKGLAGGDLGRFWAGAGGTRSDWFGSVGVGVVDTTLVINS